MELQNDFLYGFRKKLGKNVFCEQMRPSSNLLAPTVKRNTICINI